MSEELPTSFLDFESLTCLNEEEIVQLLKIHPWVKKRIDEDAPNNTSYTLNNKAYNLWLKTEEGKKYGKRGCGDDPIYTASSFLRKYMTCYFSVYEHNNDFLYFEDFESLQDYRALMKTTNLMQQTIQNHFCIKGRHSTIILTSFVHYQIKLKMKDTQEF